MFVSSLKAKLLMVLMSATAGLLVLSAVGRHPLGRCPPEEVLKGTHVFSTMSVQTKSVGTRVKVLLALFS